MDFLQDALTLSRLQFAFTAFVHFLFVPLTLGLSVLLGIMESIYVMTGKPIWKQMTQFWGVIFGINFAMGVTTGIPLEFQFGTNWSYYAHFVGDIFGSLLAMEGLMAFFMEATFIGLFFFGWNRLSPRQHLFCTWMMTLGTNLSALWILIANAWMNNPVGATFNLHTMRMEITSFFDVFFNPVAQSKFIHTVSAGYVIGSMFIVSISAFYMLNRKHMLLARRSMAIALGFGLASSCAVVVLGDESGYVANEMQKMKIAAIEGMWETEPAPAGLTLIGWPDMKSMTTHWAVKMPWVAGLIITRSFDRKVAGIRDLVGQNKESIQRGLHARHALERFAQNNDDAEAEKIFKKYQQDLGFGFLPHKYVKSVEDVRPEHIDRAALDTVPHVLPLFWAFRVMVACGLYFILFFAWGFYLSCRQRLETHRTFLWMAIVSLPLPWLAAQMGWFVAEYGRQPWAVQGMLPTFMAVSPSLEASTVWKSLFSFILLYAILSIVDVVLIWKCVKAGPHKTTY